MMKNTKGIEDNVTFGSKIHYWTLSFLDKQFENDYQNERIAFKRIPKQIKVLFILAAISNAVLIGLDLTSAYATDPDYTYEFYDKLFLILYIPIFLCEYIFFKIKKLSIFRGSFFTCFVYFMLFYTTSIRFHKYMKYPVLSPPMLLWNGCMLFVHIFYVRSWLVSLITYFFVFIEIITVIFSMYGKNFITRSYGYGITESLFYIILFGVFISISIYSFRTFELKERANFYFERQRKCELEKWRSLLSDLPEPVILVQSGKLTFCNNATKKYFCPYIEGSNDQVLRELEKVKSVNPPRNSIAKLIREQVRDHGSEDFNYKCHTGVVHKLQLKYVNIDPISGPSITEYIFYDITTVEELEREKVQRKCFRLLVGSASHEIRTPINAIKGVIGSLSEMFINKCQQTEITIAELAMKRLDLYVKELSILQQIEANTLQVIQEIFNPNDAVKKTMGYFAHNAEMKNLDLKVLDNSVQAIYSDKEKYELICYHLLENAFKYTHEGSITVKLTYIDETSELQTSILDTGDGVTDDQKTIFKLFSEKNDFDPSCPQDINLGLFIADSLTNSLGGVLRLQSLQGVGAKATFSIRNNCKTVNEEDVIEENNIPSSIASLSNYQWKSIKGMKSILDIVKPDMDEAPSQPLSTIQRFIAENCKCPKVLIVDDEPFNVFVLKKYMNGTGIKADVAMNGKAAIEIILKRRESCQVCATYKIIFMDINMPIMNGIVTTSKIKELINNYIIPEVPVIGVTAAVQLQEQKVIDSYKSYGFKLMCNLCFKSNSAETCREEYIY
jgi:CheY-like chemotaxis protein/nitrogen-specific signal transduction histidine kinase